MGDLAAMLSGAFAGKGWLAAFAPAHVLGDVRRAYDALREQGAFEHPALLEHIDALEFASDEMPGAGSVAVLALPAPPWRLTFSIRGQAVPVIVPPTYVRYQAAKDDVLAVAREALAPFGYSAVMPKLPHKALAVHLGLALYGRNNIAYVPGLGSFARLVTLLSDAPAREAGHHEPRTLERCASCAACVRACPTGAIAEDHFLVRAGRCLTLFNEEPEAMPAWIRAGAHNALIGCFECQRVCPENAAAMRTVADGPAFDDEETAALLEARPYADLPERTVAKLEDLALLGEYATWVRNLRLLAAS